MTIKQAIKKRLKMLALAGAVVCLANTAYAYTYRFTNNPPGPQWVMHVWMHTVPAPCQAVDGGPLLSGNALTLQSAGTCRVDRIEMDGHEVFSNSRGIESANFRFCSQWQICPSGRRKHR